MTSSPSPEAQRRAENADLRARLEEAEETLRAIRSGEVDSLVVETDEGPKIFSFDAAEAASNRFRGEVLAQIGDAVIAVDREDRITFFNAAAERQYGVRSDEVLGRESSEIYTRHWPRPDAEAGSWNVLREQGEWRGETVQRLHDGRELHVESSLTVLRAADGAYAGMVSAIRDITARKQLEAKLREREHFLQRLTDVTPGVLQVFDLEKQCNIFMNRTVASGLGYSAEEIAAMGADVLPTLLHPDDVARFSAHRERVRMLRDDETADFEHRMRDRTGEWHWFHSRDAVFARDASGAVCQIIGTAIEITELKRRATELQRVNALLDTLLLTLPIGFCFLDRDLRYGRINERLAEINGISAHSHLGRHVSEIVPALVESIRAVTDRILVTGEEVPNHEFSGETPAAPGVTRFWNESWYPVRDGAGEVLGFGGIVEEITERKQAQEQLRAAHDSFRHLVEHSPFGVYAVDAEFRLVQVSAGAQKMFENVRPLLGRDFAEVLRIVWSEPFASEAIAIFRQVLESGEPYHAPSTVEQRQDIAAVEAYDWKVERITLPHGRPGAVCHFYDLSERLLYEARLRENETRMRLATEATAVGIWEWNVLTNSIRWDAQMFRLYGIPPTADGFVQYSDSSGAVLPEDLPDNERVLQDTVRHGGQSRREYRIRRRDDGAVRHIECVETVRANAQGETEWVVGTSLDVTERKTAEIQLRQLAADLSEADLRKDEFLATLAHELRNPLAPIRTGAALLRSREALGPRVETLAAMIERQVDHMVRLVDDLLDVSRVTRGVIALQRERVPVAGVVANAVEAVGPLMREMGHALIVTMPPAPIVLDVDAVRMTQVISNLLNNAAKFTDRGGRIGLTVAQSSNKVVISVTDTGVGLATADVARIFDLFAQVDPSRGHAHGGLGIGLALSKRLVEMHGGTIHATSAGAGRGSEFVVRLPLGSEAPPALSPSDAGGHILSRTSRRILVVDDNHDGADMLSAMLRVDGHDTRTAYDGKTAMELAGAFRPEVVVLDIGLPTMSGYDVCRHLRAQPWATGLVVMAITGWGSAQDRRRAQDAGFDHHLVKPVESDALRRLLAMPIDQAGGGLESPATARLVAPRPHKDTVDS